jgi:hypothetical protein
MGQEARRVAWGTGSRLSARAPAGMTFIWKDCHPGQVEYLCEAPSRCLWLPLTLWLCFAMLGIAQGHLSL